MTDLTTDQLTKARRKFYAERRDADRLPSRSVKHGPMPAPMDGYLPIAEVAEAMGISRDAVRCRWRRGSLPFPMHKRLGNLYARVEDVAPHRVGMAASMAERGQFGAEAPKTTPDTHPYGGTVRTGNSDAPEREAA